MAGSTCNMPARNSESDVLRRLIPNDETGCWEWNGCRDEHGYGVVRWETRKIRAHRWMWEMRNGPIPKGMFVCHHCDNPSCANPDHLFLGTPQDNRLDCCRKKRHWVPGGEENGRAILTEEQAVYVMARLLTGRETQSAIARELGVSPATIRCIWTGSSWASLFNPQQ